MQENTPDAWIDSTTETGQSEVLPLTSVVLKHPRSAFGSRARIDSAWRKLGYAAAPDFDRAVSEYDAFVERLEEAGARLHFLPDDPATGLDSLYPRDASIVTDRGVILCRMGKSARRGEPEAQSALYRELGAPILGRIEPPGRLEGGDVAWLDSRTLAVGRTYRSNDEGIRQLEVLLGDGIEILTMEAPHWRGPSDVFHLMSVLSPVAERKALVYSPLMSVSLRQALLEREFELIETADEEFEGSLGGNGLALAPNVCLLPSGNPRTRARLERAGVETREFSAFEICRKGAGGPTCLTRPLARHRAGYR